MTHSGDGLGPIDSLLNSLRHVPAYTDEELDAGCAAVLGALERLTPERARQLDEVATSAELGGDAHAFGLDCLERGDLDRAAHWLQRAARYGVPSAEQRLDGTRELNDTVASLDAATATAAGLLEEAGVRAEQLVAEAGRVAGRMRAAAVKEAEGLLEAAKAEAERLVAEASREAGLLRVAAVRKAEGLLKEAEKKKVALIREGEELRAEATREGKRTVEEGKRELERLVHRRENLNAEISRVQDVLSALESFEEQGSRRREDSPGTSSDNRGAAGVTEANPAGRTR